MANNIFSNIIMRDKSFEEIDLQFADYHTSSYNCNCNPTIDDSWIVHNWIEHPKEMLNNLPEAEGDK